MSIKKEYSKDKSTCKVTFTLPKEIAEQFDEIALVGEFNNWDHKANLFTSKNKESITIELEAGKEYQFRYCGSGVWLNEAEADIHVLNPFGDSENSVLVI
ncbi:MAG: isoamylase early set domain-containing protein [Ignavibacteriales bacterium]|nr:isoamylase early set domain-containing protein [Ignavibacteriales bacterium]